MRPRPLLHGRYGARLPDIRPCTGPPRCRRHRRGRWRLCRPRRAAAWGRRRVVHRSPVCTPVTDTLGHRGRPAAAAGAPRRGPAAQARARLAAGPLRAPKRGACAARYKPRLQPWPRRHETWASRRRRRPRRRGGRRARLRRRPAAAARARQRPRKHAAQAPGRAGRRPQRGRRGELRVQHRAQARHQRRKRRPRARVGRPALGEQLQEGGRHARRQLRPRVAHAHHEHHLRPVSLSPPHPVHISLHPAALNPS